MINYKITKLNSKQIKNALLHYWRFNRAYCCCTELTTGCPNSTIGACNICDVAAYDFKDSFIDCEIKISKSDLISDSKKQKHYAYKNNPKIYNGCLPNKFMYVVPDVLSDDAIAQCELINPNYGVMVFFNGGYNVMIRTAKKLYSGVNKENTKKIIIKRLNSEVISLRKKLYI